MIVRISPKQLVPTKPGKHDSEPRLPSGFRDKMTVHAIVRGLVHRRQDAWKLFHEIRSPHAQFMVLRLESLGDTVSLASLIELRFVKRDRDRLQPLLCRTSQRHQPGRIYTTTEKNADGNITNQMTRHCICQRIPQPLFLNRDRKGAVLKLEIPIPSRVSATSVRNQPFTRRQTSHTAVYR